MKKYFPSVVLLFFTLSLFGFKNTGTISGVVFEAENQPALYANVILKSVADSSMVKGAVTNEKGNFELLGVPYDDYFLSISYIGFANYDSEAFTLDASTKNFPPINLIPANSELSEVTVTALRPILEMKADKMVFNVEGTINAAGENALDLLRKSPGVAIDNNENVSLLGKSGVKVFVDGKESQLSGEDLAAFLKTLQSDQMDAIEIITNPSAKYDAEGNAGIINIRMKKDKRNGTNAFINMGYSKGNRQSYNGSISANHRNKWVNVFGKYGYSDNDNYNSMYFERDQFVNGDILQFVNASYGLYNIKSNNYRFGTDFFINDKSTIGFIVDGYTNDIDNKTDATTDLLTKGNVGIDSVLIANNNEVGKGKNNNFNINYKWDIAKDQYLNIDADYGIFSNEGLDYIPNAYYNNIEKEILFSERNYKIDTQTDIDIATGKVDYERPLFSGKIGIGAKYASVKTENTFDFYNSYADNDVLNTNKSNLFDYTENVLAAYINYNGMYKKLTYQLGLRGENTDSRGELFASNGQELTPTERSYFDLFPSVSFSLPVDQKNNLQLSYTKRINRPTYQDLNPFESQLDELIYEKGNENLQPEYTNNIQLRHSYNYFLNTTLAYSRTNNVIAAIISRAPNDGNGKASIYSMLNLASQDHYSINIAAPYTVNKWWSTYTSLTGYYLHNKADYGDGNVIDFEASTFNIYSQQTFQLPWSSSFEVSGWFNSPSVWEGNFATESMWSVDAGFQKKFMNDRAKIKLSVSDVFKSLGWSGTSEFGVMSLYGEGQWDSRRFKVNLSYNFGNENVKSRRRNTGLEDENKRIESGS